MAYVAIGNGESGLNARNKINGLGENVDIHIALSGSDVHDLKTMSMQSASSVEITGGTIAGVKYPVSSITTGTTLDATHFMVLASGTISITLPTAVGIVGRIYNIKNVGTGIITILTTSSQSIDGNTSLTITTKYSSLQIIADGTGWNII
jgi:hypothetical protein